MKRPLQIIIMTGILVGFALNADAQKRPQRTSSARAAYGTYAPEFKAHKKRNKKAKKKARKSGKRKKATSNRASYFTGRPY
jgi:hypothetical protein